MEFDFNEIEKPEPETVIRKGKRSSVSGPFVCAWVLISLVLCAVICGLLYVIFQKDAYCANRVQGSTSTLVENFNKTIGEDVSGQILNLLDNETDVTTVCPPGTDSCSSTLMLSTPELSTPNHSSLNLPSLPGVISPYHYDLELFPNFFDSVADKEAEGKVTIYFTVLDKTAAINVNAVELVIDEKSVRLEAVAPTKDVPGVRSISYKNQSQLLVIHLDTELPPLGKFKVQIMYRARVYLEPHGIYAYTYASADGNIPKTTTTDFSNGFARRAFPCFDEPSFKATFNLTLFWKASESLNTWSNTEIWYQEPREHGIIADVYKRTPKMCTHDLAFTVGNYAYLQNVTSSRVKFRTFSRPGELQRLQLFHKHGPVVFDWFVNTFGLPYPLPKYDNVVVKNAKDGVVGHMGRTTFRESLVSTEEGVIAEQRLARLITEGVSRQWFGSLVTPAGEEWAWLSKGIAAFLDSYALSKIFPEWREMEMFIAKVHSSMKMDVGITRPVSTTEDSHDQMMRAKGASIFRMLFYTLGEEATLRGLNMFLWRHQYRSVTFSDLWTVLDEVASEGNVAMVAESFLDPWLTQKHFPLVTVQRSRPGSVHVKQELFKKDMSSQADSGYAPYGYTWDIPVMITSSLKGVWNTSSQNRDILWLRKSEPEATFHNLSIPDEADPDGWILINPDVIGYYRVNYDDRNWQALLEQLKRDHTVFSAQSRSQMINDAFALYKSRVLDVTIALGTLDYLQYELDYLPWLTALREISELDAIMDRTRLYEAFQHYMKDRLNAAFQHCGLLASEDDVPMDMLQRKQIAEWACQYGLEACLDGASAVFAEWTEGKRILSADVRATVYCHGVMNGGQDAWDVVYNASRNTSLPSSHKKALDRALGCASEPSVIERLLERFLPTGTPDLGQRDAILYTLTRSHQARDAVWTYIQQHTNTQNYDLRPILAGAEYLHKSEVFTHQLSKMFRNATDGDATLRDGALSSIKRKTTAFGELESDLEAWLTKTGYSPYIS